MTHTFSPCTQEIGADRSISVSTECEASLLYRASVRTARAAQRIPVLNLEEGKLESVEGIGETEGKGRYCNYNLKNMHRYKEELIHIEIGSTWYTLLEAGRTGTSALKEAQ